MILHELVACDDLEKNETGIAVLPFKHTAKGLTVLILVILSCKVTDGFYVSHTLLKINIL
jgi:hypothetical protein